MTFYKPCSTSDFFPSPASHILFSFCILEFSSYISSTHTQYTCLQAFTKKKSQKNASNQAVENCKTMYGNIPMELRKPNIKWTSDWINFGLAWPQWCSFEENGQIGVLDFIKKSVLDKRVFDLTFKQTVKVSKSYFYALWFWTVQIILLEYQLFWMGPICFGWVQIILNKSKSVKLVHKSLIWTWPKWFGRTKIILDQ